MFQRGAELVFVNVQGDQESIPPAYVAWQAGASNTVVVLARQSGNRFSILRLLKRFKNSGSDLFPSRAINQYIPQRN